MRKITLSVFLVVFFVVTFSAQSWAMGRRHSSGNGSHHQGANFGGQSEDSFTENSGQENNGPNNHNDGDSGLNNSNSDGNYGNNGNSGDNDNPGNNGNSGNGGNSERGGFYEETNSGGTGDEHFPMAPVPEPTTLALMGMGLSGIFLKRKKG